MPFFYGPLMLDCPPLGVVGGSPAIEAPDRCRLSDINGGTEYEGEFVPYGRKPALPTDQMRINADKTREQKLWVGYALVPLVYLRNGDVLIPVDKYEEGSQMLAKSKSS